MEWPLDLPARELLTRAGRPAIPWACFDAEWYVRTYRPPVEERGRALDFYLAAGQQLGHSPNPFFDELWHRAEYPVIAARVGSGEYASAFDAYCRHGCLDRSPHWLFNELYYRDVHRDLTDETLRAAQLANGYEHYLRHGVHEGRSAHLLFDTAFYLAHFDPSDVPAIQEQGAFQHYLMRLEGRQPELRTSIYFDPEWYRRRYPQVEEAVRSGRWKSALHHYLCNDTPAEFDPLESFSEAHYLARDPGLRAVVQERQFRNGYMHFLRFGAQELRSPSPFLDLAWYAGRPAVKAAVKAGAPADAFAHWLTVGSREGLAGMPAPAERTDVRQAASLAQGFAESLRPVTGRFGVRFDSIDEAALSVILVVREAVAGALATMTSLRASTARPLELIVVDLTPAREMVACRPYLPGARMLPLAPDTGWAHAAEAARQLASAPLLLFISPAVRVVPGSVDRAEARLAASGDIGAIGGLVLQPHGVIAQAGGIVWRDGATHDYLAGESPLLPEANFVRCVDFCSAVFLMVRAGLCATLDGFDPAMNGGYEAVDLCLRIAAAGHRVVYDPSVIVVETACHAARQDGAAFTRRHAGTLARRAVASGPMQVFARHADVPGPRILLLEDTIPLRRLGSGFIRCNDIVRALASLGAAVTVFPVNGSDHPLEHVYGDLPDTVEVMHNQDVNRLEAFLRARSGYYDCIWVARGHNLQKTLPILDAVPGQDNDPPALILDTEALTPCRDAQRALLLGEKADPGPALRHLAALAARCAVTIAVTAGEAALLHDLGLSNVVTIAHAIEGRPTPRPHAQRAGLLFVGAIHTADSPNLDSLNWFVEHVLPRVEEELGWETRLTIAGYVAPGVDMGRFHDHPRITLCDAPPDLESLYNTHRVFVAPTRYAAGAPYKVLEAASRGVPVACSELLRHQLGWVAEREVASAGTGNAADLAGAILALYRDAELWRLIRENALRRLRREYGWADFSCSVAHAVGSAESARIARTGVGNRPSGR